MAHLIDKDAVLAEIERRIKEYQSTGDDYWFPVIENLKNILSFLDDLEVKEMNLEKDVRQILSLYYEGIKHYDDIIKEERKENGGSDLAIKIMDGVVDAKELGIQYVIDKLKAQKGE